ncbi:MAG: hypothetical protein Q4F84_01115 [Fibrobacter sp.]|nr:hypothetical protein [Fibrobacter sp.]
MITLTLQQIAKETNLSPETVRKVCRKLRIDTRREVINQKSRLVISEQDSIFLKRNLAESIRISEKNKVNKKIRESKKSNGKKGIVFDEAFFGKPSDYIPACLLDENGQ